MMRSILFIEHSSLWDGADQLTNRPIVCTRHYQLTAQYEETISRTQRWILIFSFLNDAPSYL